jgi:energy-converting hydrogenase Eha subunit C
MWFENYSFDQWNSSLILRFDPLRLRIVGMAHLFIQAVLLLSNLGYLDFGLFSVHLQFLANILFTFTQVMLIFFNFDSPGSR